jgi:hypothetical protein
MNPASRERKKSNIHTRLSCKIDYLLRSNHNDQSIASEFFTDDDFGLRNNGERGPTMRAQQTLPL